MGKHGSIAVTERAILTLKSEWLGRVPIIRGLDHLTALLDDFEVYYNEYRAHMTLGGAIPESVHQGESWYRPDRAAKVLPTCIERRIFADTKVTAFRLAA